MTTKIKVFARSENKKTGDITQTYSTSNTCPNRCPFKECGCYADIGPASWAWKKVNSGSTAEDFSAYFKYINRKTRVLRHNIAGDLAISETNNIDTNLLQILNEAYKKHAAYTYTHCSISAKNIESVKASKMVINFSCENMKQVKKCVANNVPCVLTVKSISETHLFIDGIKFEQCPATVDDDINDTCATCQKCLDRNRDYVIVFPWHGVKKAPKFLLDI